MKSLFSKDVAAKLSKIQSLTLPKHDRTEGIKTGTMFRINPQLGEFKMIDKIVTGANGSQKYELSEPTAFQCANIMLYVSRRDKDTGEYIKKPLPAFAINMKLDSDDKNLNYVTMLFRNTTIQGIAEEIINCNDTGEDLYYAKAFYGILRDNDYTDVKQFDTDVQAENVTLTFAMRKKGKQMNFVDVPTYSKSSSTVTEHATAEM